VHAAARFAGTAVRITRRPLRSAARAAPGVAGAAGIAVGLGQVAGHVFGRGLTWWVALAVGSGFALWFGAEINASPLPPPPDG
jgi:hypothetical protein